MMLFDLFGHIPPALIIMFALSALLLFAVMTGKTLKGTGNRYPHTHTAW
jgi:hypothetical protein